MVFVCSFCLIYDLLPVVVFFFVLLILKLLVFQIFVQSSALSVLIHVSLPLLLYRGNVLNQWPCHPSIGRASAGLLLMGSPAPP